MQEAVMEGEGGTSRLLGLLLREREREELENKERKESAFTTVKNNFSRKFSFRKVKVETRKQTLKEEKPFHKRIFYKLTNTFRKSFPRHLTKYSQEYAEEEEVIEEGNPPSVRDSAYFSQSHGCCSKSVSETQKHSEEANNTFESSSSSSSLSTSSRCPSLTTSANRILRNNSQQKKSVTILLPHIKTRENPFGPHLTIEDTRIFSLPQKASHNKGDISNQLNKIRNNAKYELIDQFPSITSTINYLFIGNPRPILMSMSSTKIGDLIFNLRSLLFSPLLPRINYFNIILFEIVKFLHTVVLVLDCEELEVVKAEIEDSYQNCSDKECLNIIRRVFINIWCSLLLRDFN